MKNGPSWSDAMLTDHPGVGLCGLSLSLPALSYYIGSVWCVSPALPVQAGPVLPVDSWAPLSVPCSRPMGEETHFQGGRPTGEGVTGRLEGVGLARVLAPCAPISWQHHSVTPWEGAELPPSCWEICLWLLSLLAAVPWAQPLLRLMLTGESVGQRAGKEKRLRCEPGPQGSIYLTVTCHAPRGEMLLQPPVSRKED